MRITQSLTMYISGRRCIYKPIALKIGSHVSFVTLLIYAEFRSIRFIFQGIAECRPYKPQLVA